VHVQDRPAPSHHHGRPCDVLGAGLFVEGAGEHVEGDGDARQGSGFTIVARLMGAELRLGSSDRSPGPPAIVDSSPDTW